MNLVEILTRLISFSPELSLKIGLKEAVQLHNIITRFKFEPFDQEIADLALPGIGFGDSQIKSLLKQEYLIDLGDNQFAVNKKKFMLQTGKNVNVKKEYRVYDSDEFENLLDKWNEIVFKRIGKKYNTSDFIVKFQDVAFDVALEALKHCVQNSNLTLNFEYARKRLSGSAGNEKYPRSNKDGARSGIGARYGRPETDAATSELSKRAISLE